MENLLHKITDDQTTETETNENTTATNAAPTGDTGDLPDFKSLNLPDGLMQALDDMGFNTPTPIQAQAIPAALKGKDILGSAQTGTGKTGAFGIPLIAGLMNNGRATALIMTPTRELAMQVLKALEAMAGKRSGIKGALLIGGESMPKQTQQLRARPRLIVGTPGRINDHLERGNLMLHQTQYLVLDETDRMLDMGFSHQIEKIVKFLPDTRQTMLFSATLPKDMIRVANKYLTNPVRVEVGGNSKPIARIKQETVNVSDAGKYDELHKQLNERNGSVIIFVRTKWGADKMATRLRRDNHSAEAIHGDLSQNKRERVIKAFRDSKHRVLVATDIASRGLDIPHIEHVINYDLPQCPEDYIHRIGRTARAGAEGSSLAFLTNKDADLWRAISRLLDPDAKQEPRSTSGSPKGNGPKGNGGGNGGRPSGFKKRRSGGPANAGPKGGNSSGKPGKYRSSKPNGGQRKPSAKAA